MQYAKAKKIADRIVEIFTPHIDLIHIAGSVRRRKPEVKDIEICCIAKHVPTDLFGAGDLKVVPGFKAAINTIASQIIKGKEDGRYMQIVLKGALGLKLDIFMPERDDYYRQYAIRTGSADYSAKVIASGWVAKGWCGTDRGLRRQDDCNRSPSGWKIVNTKGEKPPIWESEEQFFEWLGVKWIEPNLRNL